MALDDDIDKLKSSISDLRSEVLNLRNEMRATTSMAASAQNSISSHAAVCEERYRQQETRQRDRDILLKEQAQTFTEFMQMSAADRSHIRESLLTNASAARDELRSWMLKAITCIAGFNIVGAFITIGGMFKLFGIHS